MLEMLWSVGVVGGWGDGHELTGSARGGAWRGRLDASDAGTLLLSCYFLMSLCCGVELESG